MSSVKSVLMADRSDYSDEDQDSYEDSAGYASDGSGDDDSMLDAVGANDGAGPSTSRALEDEPGYKVLEQGALAKIQVLPAFVHLGTVRFQSFGPSGRSAPPAPLAAPSPGSCLVYGSDRPDTQ